ncbi:MAG: hypothetical protein GY822_08455, partial [Deltaproteobacteria bacterium]|nr:hypothetical protein [Deltaproteobacteria bacterium]
MNTLFVRAAKMALVQRQRTRWTAHRCGHTVLDTIAFIGGRRAVSRPEMGEADWRTRRETGSPMEGSVGDCEEHQGRVQSELER